MFAGALPEKTHALLKKRLGVHREEFTAGEFLLHLIPPSPSSNSQLGGESFGYYRSVPPRRLKLPDFI
jgi:hypothetical protein